MNWIGSSSRHRFGHAKTFERKHKAFFERKRYGCRTPTSNTNDLSFCKKDRSRDLVHLECVTGMRRPSNQMINSNEISVGSSGDIMGGNSYSCGSNSSRYFRSQPQRNSRIRQEAIHLPNVSPMKEASRLEFADTADEDCMEAFPERKTHFKFNRLPSYQSTPISHFKTQNDTVEDDVFRRNPDSGIRFGKVPLGDDVPPTSLEEFHNYSQNHGNDEEGRDFPFFEQPHSFLSNHVDFKEKLDDDINMQNSAPKEFPLKQHMYKKSNDDDRSLLSNERRDNMKLSFTTNAPRIVHFDDHSTIAEAFTSEYRMNSNDSCSSIKDITDSLPHFMDEAQNANVDDDESIPMIESCNKSWRVDLFPSQLSSRVVAMIADKGDSQPSPLVNLSDGLPALYEDDGVASAEVCAIYDEQSRPDLKAVCSRLEAFKQQEIYQESIRGTLTVESDVTTGSNTYSCPHNFMHYQKHSNSDDMRCVPVAQTSTSISVMPSTPPYPKTRGSPNTLEESLAATSAETKFKDAFTQTNNCYVSNVDHGTQTCVIDANNDKGPAVDLHSSPSTHSISPKIRRSARLQKSVNV